MIELILCGVILVCVSGLYLEANVASHMEDYYRADSNKYNKKYLELLMEYTALKQKLTRTNQPRDSKGRFIKKGR